MMRAVALNPNPDNLLDHLGVLAAILEIPLIVTEEKTQELAREFYPATKTILIEEPALILDFLAANFDVIFISSKLQAIEMYPLFPLLYQKNMRIVYCPHGNSDKGHSLPKDLHNPEDVSLIYGDHMRDLLEHNGMLAQIRQIIPIGNYRHAFFQEHQPFYQQHVANLLAKLDPTKKMILYAPTWDCQENPTSFYRECSALIEQLTAPFNLVIKLHHHLYEKHPARTLQICEQYKNHPQVVFVDDFPPVYPLLALAEAYLGDFSSIGYDFLTFDKPMYFFNPAGSELEKDRGRFLHRCGLEISTRQNENVFDFISRTLEANREQFRPVRRQVYTYAFGKARSLAAVREEIVRELS